MTESSNTFTDLTREMSHEIHLWDLNGSLQLTENDFDYFPKIIFTIAAPIFRSAPDFVVGMPVSLANFCFAWVIPTKRFHENENPLIISYLMDED